MNDISPRSLLRYGTWVIFKHKYSILSILVFTLLCFAAGTFLITPQWKATAKLMVMQDPRQQMILFGDLQAPTPDGRVSAIDLVEILTGNDMAQKIVTEFELDERLRRKAQEPATLSEKAKYWLVQAFNSPRTLMVGMGMSDPPVPNWFEKALDELIEDMEDIELIEETSTINVSIWADDRDLAVNICNAMVEHLMEKTREFDRSEAVNTYNFLTTQLESVEASLASAEDELMQFKVKYGIVELEIERGLLLQRFDTLSTQAAQQQARLAAFTARLVELESQLGGPAAASTSGVSTAADDVSEPPTAAAQSNRYDTYRNAINERQTEQDILAARVQQAEVRGEFDSLQADLAAVQRKLDTFNEVELESQRLQRAHTGLRDRYMNLRSKQLALEVQKFNDTSQFDVKIGDPAYIPPRARTDWPSWGINLAAGLVFGIVFAFGQAFFFEYWRDSLHDAEEVADVCGVEVLGSVRPVSFKHVARKLLRKPVPSAPRSGVGPTDRDEPAAETLKVDVASTQLSSAKRAPATSVTGASN